MTIWLTLVALNLPALAINASSAAETSAVEEEISRRVKVSVRVVPRIGLFDPLHFRSYFAQSALHGPTRACITLQKIEQGDRKSLARVGQYKVDDSWRPLDENAYLAEIGSSLRGLFPQTVICEPGWQLLTAETADNRFSQYVHRLVRITAAYSDSADFPSKCPDLELKGTHLGVAIGRNPSSWRCEYSFWLASNERTEFQIRLDLSGIKPVWHRGYIPKDFLIVSLGDSFASGEGNPDRLARSATEDSAFPRDVETPVDPPEPSEPALWMDARCHRSVWAGPIRAGLSLIGNEAALPSKQDGAFTVLSLACSGASIERGLIGPYEGAIDATEYQKTFMPREIKAADPVGNLPQGWVPTQLSQLREFLDAQDINGAKRDIDALVMSFGGNDIGFGPFLRYLVMKNPKKADLDLIKNFHLQNFPKLPALYEGMASDLRDCLGRARGKASPRCPEKRRPKNEYWSSHTILTGYPDPNKKGDPARSPCTGTPYSGSVMSFLLRALGKEITADEAKLASEEIAGPLNRHGVTHVEREGWQHLDVARDFVGGGWCYKRRCESRNERECRLLWQVDESERRQGDMSGAMHPTEEGHQRYALRIEEAIVKAQKEPLELSVEESVVERSKRRYVRAPLQPRVKDFQKKPAGMHHSCMHLSGEPRCNPVERGAPDNVPELKPIELIGQALHSETRKIWEQPLGQVHFDHTAPRVDYCGVVSVSGAMGRECSDTGWIKAGEVVAIAGHDGEASCRSVNKLAGPVAQGKTRAADMPAACGVGVRDVTADVRYVAKELVSDRVLFSIGSYGSDWIYVDEDLPDGQYELRVRSTDWLGNTDRGQDRRWQLSIDRVSPNLEMTVHQHVLRAGDNERVIPYHRNQLGLSVRVTDDHSGADEVSLHLLSGDPASGKPIRQEAMETKIVRPSQHSEYFSGQDLDRPVLAQIVATDHAGNEAVSFPLRFEPVSRFKAIARSISGWQAVVKSDPAIVQRVGRFAGIPAPPAPESPFWPYYAAWLNLANGSVLPSDHAEDVITADCGVRSNGSALLAYALLRKVDACIVRLSGGEKLDAFLQQVGNYLMSSGLIPAN